jgi:hypothetical protein
MADGRFIGKIGPPGTKRGGPVPRPTKFRRDLSLVAD